jgi:RNA recognition motif-containing protein
MCMRFDFFLFWLGFVTFSTPEVQKKALDAFDGKELDGRTLTVKVAHKDDRRDAKGELREEFKTADTREARQPRGPRRDGGSDNKGSSSSSSSAAPSEKKPSETVVYVSNLPFEFTDADLSKVTKSCFMFGFALDRFDILC